MITNTPTRRHRGSLTVTAAVLMSLSTAFAAPPTTVSDTYGTIVIGDLPGMMDRGAELGQLVNPGISGNVLRGQLGMILGDEGLKSIAPGSGMVIAIPTAGQPFMLLETAEGKAEDVAGLVKQRLPNASTQAVNDKLVALTMDQAAMEKASGAMGTAAAALLENNDDKFLLATIDTDKLMQDKGPQLHATLKRISGQIAASGDEKSTGTGNALAFLGHLVTAAAKRTDVATIKIDISGEGVEFEKTLWPIGGVNLQEPEGPTGQELLKIIPPAQDPMLRYDYYLDNKSAFEALKPMMAEAFTGAGVASSDQAEIMRIFDLARDAFGDGIAGWLSFGDDSVRGIYLLTVTDSEKALQYIEEATASMTTGSMAKLYSGLGLETSATFTRNARTVDDEQAHTFAMSMESADGDKKSTAGMQIKDSVITIINDKMLMVMGDVPPEPAVAAVKSGSGTGQDLESRRQLPPDGAMYVDYNVGAVMATMAKHDPQMAQFADTMKDVTILEAAYVTDESLKFIMRVPGEMVTKLASGIQAKGRMQAGQATTGTVEADATTTDVQESRINVKDSITTR